MSENILGLVTGVLFGFLMQKGRVLRFEKQVNAMLLRDMTILKFMLSAIIVGMVGIYLLNDMGLIAIRHKTMDVGAIGIGGILFGLGWAIMGFCPGTSIGALGEGRWHAVWAILGMITGAGIYAEIYPFFVRTVIAGKDWGKISLAELIGVNHWLVIVVLIAA